MQKYLWSTVILMLATSVATYLAATCRTCPNCCSEKIERVQSKPGDLGKTGQIQPLVLIPTQTPAFMIEPIEPIAVEPEPPQCPDRWCSKFIVRAEARTLAPTPCRMPYADESTPDVELVAAKKEEVQADVNWWSIVGDLIQQILPLPGTDVEPIDPGIEAPTESAPPVQQSEETPATPLMPMADYHHSGCPYHYGCPRGYSTFPPPAYQFDRQTPFTEPMPTSESTPPSK